MELEYQNKSLNSIKSPTQRARQKKIWRWEHSARGHMQEKNVGGLWIRRNSTGKESEKSSFNVFKVIFPSHPPLAVHHRHRSTFFCHNQSFPSQTEGDGDKSPLWIEDGEGMGHGVVIEYLTSTAIVFTLCLSSTSLSACFKVGCDGREKGRL